MLVGYTTGVYDLFHIGHLNLLRNAKGLCDKLIVGVSTDELVKNKGKKSIIPYNERIEIVRNINYVDIAVAQHDVDKYKDWRRLKYNILFVGDDWFETASWEEHEARLKQVGVKVVYLPYTSDTSSTIISQTLKSMDKV